MIFRDLFQIEMIIIIIIFFFDRLYPNPNPNLIMIICRHTTHLTTSSLTTNLLHLRSHGFPGQSYIRRATHWMVKPLL